jgi:hypothetical protein
MHVEMLAVQGSPEQPSMSSQLSEPLAGVTGS